MLRLNTGDVIVTKEGTFRIGLKANAANRFITLAQANEMLRNEQIQFVSVDIAGDEVLLTPAEAIAYMNNND